MNSFGLTTISSYTLLLLFVIFSFLQINLVDTLNDAMYSDSRLVLDALAELLESALERHHKTTTAVASSSHEQSRSMLTQVRYIMQVDEDSFRSNITADQLLAIESKEMAVILEEFVSSVGLQRFRFSDRQASGT